MSRTYTISDRGMYQFSGFYLLKFIKDNNYVFGMGLKDPEVALQPVFDWLLERDYVALNDEKYEVTSKGEDVLTDFVVRFERFLSDFDVFCAVDLEAGEFALERYHEFSDSDQWQEFLAQERFEDLRVAVAEHEGLDPIEVVFMSCVTSGRYGADDDGWHEENLTGSVWTEILAVVNSSLKVDDLGYEDDNGEVSGQEVIADIIEQGKQIMSELKA